MSDNIKPYSYTGGYIPSGRTLRETNKTNTQKKVEEVATFKSKEIKSPSFWNQVKNFFKKPSAVIAQNKAKEQERVAVFKQFQKARPQKGLTKEGLDTKLSGKVQKQEAIALRNALLDLDKVLSEDPKNYKEANAKVFKFLRRALETEAYQQLKKDENHPAVEYLHKLALSSLLETEVTPTYMSLGDELSDKNNITGPTDHKSLPKILEGFRQKIHKGGLFKTDMNNPFYLLTHTKSALGALQSQKKVGSYDPRSELENNAGKFFEKEVVIFDKEVKINHFFSPSWRYGKVGSKIPPEIHAALQSLENQHNLGKTDVPVILYENAQDFTKGPESVSSSAIMSLHDDYPSAFVPLTIPFDTEFHNAGLGHSDSTLWNDIVKQEGWQTFNDFKNEFLKTLKDEKNFSTQPQGEGGPGYYFPTVGEMDKDTWKETFEDIVNVLSSSYKDQFEQLVNEAKNSPEARIKLWQLRASMIEEANLIISYVAQNAVAQTSSNISIVSVCKELADRGKMRSIEHLYVSANDKEGQIPEDVAKLIRDVSEARPLAARNRIGLAHRNQHGYALMQNRAPNQIRQNINEVLSKLGGTISSFNVTLPNRPMPQQ